MIISLARRVTFAAAAAVFVIAGSAAAYAAGPFSGLNGVWNGGGTIALQNGNRERIRCRATYAVGDDGNSLQQSLRCASDSYNFELRSDVRSSAGAISGSWNEVSRGIFGNLTGQAQRGNIVVQVQSATFNANLTLVSRGNQQSIEIRSLGNTEFAGATITLNRQG